jgi:hypothetical protein
MIQTVNNSDFHNAFNSMDRGNQFSYEALNLIYEYLEQFEQDTGEPVELDVIAICCEYSEMSYTDIIGNYDTDITDSDANTEEEQIAYIKDWLSDNTMLIGESTDGVFVFQQF